MPPAPTPAHPDLSNREERLWRLVQTHTLPCRYHLHRIYPSVYPSTNCTACGAVETLDHLLWNCPHNPYLLLADGGHWAEALGSFDLSTQRVVTARAAADTGTPVTTSPKGPLKAQ